MKTGYATGAGVWDPTGGTASKTYKFTVTLDANTPSTFQSTTGQASISHGRRRLETRSRSLSYSWLPITIRWTALGMVMWPLAAIAVATLMFGMNAVVTDGDSMHPALRRGDVVLTSPDSTDLVPGQVVMFDTENGRTTHRLVANTEAG